MSDRTSGRDCIPSTRGRRHVRYDRRPHELVTSEHAVPVLRALDACTEHFRRHHHHHQCCYKRACGAASDRETGNRGDQRALTPRREIKHVCRRTFSPGKTVFVITRIHAITSTRITPHRCCRRLDVVSSTVSAVTPWCDRFEVHACLYVCERDRNLLDSCKRTAPSPADPRVYAR